MLCFNGVSRLISVVSECLKQQCNSHNFNKSGFFVSKPDQIFSKPLTTETFKFDEVVAEVFPDMISRSVPGYSAIIEGIGKLAYQLIQPDTMVYDLGCSLGAATLSIREQVTDRNYSIIGLDNSSAMVERCRQHLQIYRSDIPTEIKLADILNYDFKPASFIALNFTLQFLDKARRLELLKTISRIIVPGGALILSEKLAFNDKNTEHMFTELHHQFKKSNGYSDLEIAQKRAALEKILIPESYQEHSQRLYDVGFSQVDCWFQHYNFASFVAVKPRA